MSRKGPSSGRWLARQRKDPYVKRTRDADLGSRAHFKLAQLDRRFRLLSSRTGGVLELGAAPGGWTRYVAAGPARGPLVAVDRRAMRVPRRVIFVQGTYGAPDVEARLAECFAGHGVDLVLSDMAPNISGVRSADEAAHDALLQLATGAALRLLNPGGTLVVKMFQNPAVDEWAEVMRRSFERVALAKPEASRAGSRELYGLALHRV